MIAWAVLATFVAGGWYIRVLLFPWKDCPRCDGGKRIASGSVHRDCGRCGSEGRVRRFGAPREER